MTSHQPDRDPLDVMTGCLIGVVVGGLFWIALILAVTLVAC